MSKCAEGIGSAFGICRCYDFVLWMRNISFARTTIHTRWHKQNRLSPFSLFRFTKKQFNDYINIYPHAFVHRNAGFCFPIILRNYLHFNLAQNVPFKPICFSRPFFQRCCRCCCCCRVQYVSLDVDRLVHATHARTTMTMQQYDDCIYLRLGPRCL